MGGVDNSLPPVAGDFYVLLIRLYCCGADGIAYTFGSQRGGVMTLTYRDGERVDTRHDSVAFGVSTSQRDAVLVHLVSANSNDYISVELVGMHVLLWAAGQLRQIGAVPILPHPQPWGSRDSEGGSGL